MHCPGYRLVVSELTIGDGGIFGGHYWCHWCYGVLEVPRNSNSLLLPYSLFNFVTCSRLQAWWALWLPRWPPAECNNVSMLCSFLVFIRCFLFLYHCCILSEIKLTPTTTASIKKGSFLHPSYPTVTVLAMYCSYDVVHKAYLILVQF